MTKKEPIFDQVRRLLEKHKGQHNRIARETGVPQSTISRLHQGDCQPRLGTVQPLLDWFDKQAAGATVKPNPKPKVRKSGAGRITVAKPGRIARRAGVDAPSALAQ